MIQVASISAFVVAAVAATIAVYTRHNKTGLFMAKTLCGGALGALLTVIFLAAIGGRVN